MESASDIIGEGSFKEKVERIRRGEALRQSEREQIIIPNATQVPNRVFDEIMPELKESELKVLMYLLRKTFGYKKLDGDYIPLSQIMKGTRTKEGRMQDNGTGLSKVSALSAISNLERLGLVEVTRKKINKDTNSINFYRLTLKG